MKKILLIILLIAVNANAQSFSGSTSSHSKGYKYKKAHTVEGSADGTLTDYQVKITVNRGKGTDSGQNVYIPANKVRADFNDIRFKLSDGTELDHARVTASGLNEYRTVNSPNASTFLHATGVVAINLDNDLNAEYVQGWGSTLESEETISGTLIAYDDDGTVLWSFASDSNDYVMGVDGGDLDGDGDNDIAVCYRLLDSSVHGLDGLTGEEIWQYDDPAGSIYFRGIAVGNFTEDEGNEVAVANNNGFIMLLTGTAGTELIRTQKYSGYTGQNISASDIDGDGWDEAIVSWGNHSGASYIEAYDVDDGSSFNQKWRYTITNAENTYANQPAVGLNIDSPLDYAIAYTGQDTTAGSGKVGVLDKDGNNLWEKSIFYHKDPVSPASLAVVDIDHDGGMEVIAAGGWGPSGANFAPPYGSGYVWVSDEEGNFKYSQTFDSNSTSEFTVGDIDGDGFNDLVVPTNNKKVHIYNGLANSTADFYVKIPSIDTSSGAVVDIYYGNRSAKDASDPDNTFLVYNDFSSTTGWTSNGGGALFQVDRGGYYIETAADINKVTSGNIDTGLTFSGTFAHDWDLHVFYRHDITDTAGRNRIALVDSGRATFDSRLEVDSSLSTSNYYAGGGDSGTAWSLGWNEVVWDVDSDGTDLILNDVIESTTSNITNVNAQRFEILGHSDAGTGKISSQLSTLFAVKSTTNVPAHGSWGSEQKL